VLRVDTRLHLEYKAGSDFKRGTKLKGIRTGHDVEESAIAVLGDAAASR